MKKYISAIVATLIMVLFIVNYNSIFNYEDIKEESYVKPYIEDLSILEEGYVVDKEYDSRPSIRELITQSGNMGETNLQFNKPDEFAELTKEDNQKIFFFGRLDPDKPIEEEVVEGTKLDEWDEWGYGGDTSTTPPPEFQESETEIQVEWTEPIEVELDQFLTK